MDMYYCMLFVFLVVRTGANYSLYDFKDALSDKILIRSAGVEYDDYQTAATLIDSFKYKDHISHMTVEQAIILGTKTIYKINNDGGIKREFAVTYKQNHYVLTVDIHIIMEVARSLSVHANKK